MYLVSLKNDSLATLLIRGIQFLSFCFVYCILDIVVVSRTIIFFFKAWKTEPGIVRKGMIRDDPVDQPTESIKFYLVFQ